MAVMPDDLLTLREAAAMLRVSTFTVVRYCKSGKLAEIKLPTGHRRIPRAEVERLLREGRAGR